jgi:hypothetical protein
LRKLGHEPKPGLTKGEASGLIDELQAKGQEYRWEKAQEDHEKNTAWVYHRVFNEAQEALGLAERGEITDAREELRDAREMRTLFWQNVFSSVGEWDDYTDQLAALSDAAEGLFKKPSRKVIQEVLDRLDAASPEWDRTGPEQFISALAELHPELVKKVRQSKARGGCLVASIPFALVGGWLLC